MNIDLGQLKDYEIEELREARISNMKSLNGVWREHKQICHQGREGWLQQQSYDLRSQSGGRYQKIQQGEEYIEPLLYVHLVQTRGNLTSGLHEASISRNLILKERHVKTQQHTRACILLQTDSGREIEYSRREIFSSSTQKGLWGSSLFLASNWFVDDFVKALMRCGPFRAYELYAKAIFEDF